MRTALVAPVLLLASSVAADAQTSVTLDQVFADYCAAQASANSACGNDSSATSAYKWLLLDDVCAHGDSHAYCSRFASISRATEPCVVAYSHRRGRWRPLHSLEASGKWAYDTDVNGAPTIVVSRTGECTAIVEDTKPLTYDVELGAVEEKENDLFAGLKDLAGLLGATLRRPLSIIGRAHAIGQVRQLRRARQGHGLARAIARGSWRSARRRRGRAQRRRTVGHRGADAGRLGFSGSGRRALARPVRLASHTPAAGDRLARWNGANQSRSRRFSTRRRRYSIAGKTSRKPSPPLRRLATAGVSSSSARA